VVNKRSVAVIAPGGMGAAVGARLAERGARVVTLLEGRSEASVKRAVAASMTPVSDIEVAAADVVLSIVPPGQALALADRLQPALRAANRKPIYVDCNAVGPATVKDIAATISGTDCPFVDGGIIGGPPRAGYDGPSIYISGPEAVRVEWLGQFGLKVRAMAGAVGDASALKMSYGGLTKGVIALGSALVLAAERAGVADALRAELAESQAGMLTQLNRGVPDMFAKAYRWVAELEEVARYVGPREEAQIFQGIAGLYDRLAEDFDGSKAEIGALARFFSPRESSSGR
jgi:3-hydroxyisobutyrate dehydrogenase-like beta-hydroxyacid dehydrogenase